jgi:nucleoside 2-deoxyribosyltransferase
MYLTHASIERDPWRELQARFGREPLVLYLAGPLRGDGTAQAIRANQVRMMARARLIQDLLPRAVLVVPHGNFAYVDESGPGGLGVRARVLEACERLLLRCDGLILCGTVISAGMARELAVAEAAGLPVVQLPETPVMARLGACAPEYGPYRPGCRP